MLGARSVATAFPRTQTGTRLPRTIPLYFSQIVRSMADVQDSIPHVVRTATDQRQDSIYNANISRIELVNKRIRLIRLSLQKDEPPLHHLPGQYIDLYIPNIDVVGGFTITSPPQTAILRPKPPTSTHPVPTNENTSDFPYLDLAIQASPNNPPAAYLWREPSTILNEPVSLRIGGNFTYPPATLSMKEFRRINNVVFVAGGVGINPIISMIRAMDFLGPGRLGGMVRRVRVLYSSKREPGDHGQKEEVLFENQLRAMAARYKDSKDVDFVYRFYETGSGGKGRIKNEDLFDAVGDVEMRKNTLVYVCGVPTMTDEFVGLLRGTEGLDEKRVLCEKWW